MLNGGSGSPPDRFEMVNGILYWRLRDGRLATCIPATMVRRVLMAAHESFGHWGFDKTWAFVKARFYRPGLSDTVREYVRQCPDCQRVKAFSLRISSCLLTLPIRFPSSARPL